MSASSPRTKRKVSPIRWPAPERGSEHAQKRPKLATEYGYWSARASSPNYNALTRSTSSRVTRMRSEDGDCSNADVTGSHQHVVMSQSPVSNGASSSERTATSSIAAKGLLQLFREKDDIGPLNTSSRGISCDRFFQKKDAGSVGHGVAYVPEMDEKLSRKYSALNSESAISSHKSLNLKTNYEKNSLTSQTSSNLMPRPAKGNRDNHDVHTRSRIPEVGAVPYESDEYSDNVAARHTRHEDACSVQEKGGGLFCKRASATGPYALFKEKDNSGKHNTSNQDQVRREGLSSRKGSCLHNQTTQSTVRSEIAVLSEDDESLQTNVVGSTRLKDICQLSSDKKKLPKKHVSATSSPPTGPPGLHQGNERSEKTSSSETTLEEFRKAAEKSDEFPGEYVPCTSTTERRKLFKEKGNDGKSNSSNGSTTLGLSSCCVNENSCLHDPKTPSTHSWEMLSKDNEHLQTKSSGPAGMGDTYRELKNIDEPFRKPASARSTLATGSPALTKEDEKYEKNSASHQISKVGSLYCFSNDSSSSHTSEEAAVLPKGREFCKELFACPTKHGKICAAAEDKSDQHPGNKASPTSTTAPGRAFKTEGYGVMCYSPNQNAMARSSSCSLDDISLHAVQLTFPNVATTLSGGDGASQEEPVSSIRHEETREAPESNGELSRKHAASCTCAPTISLSAPPESRDTSGYCSASNRGKKIKSSSSAEKQKTPCSTKLKSRFEDVAKVPPEGDESSEKNVTGRSETKKGRGEAYIALSLKDAKPTLTSETAPESTSRLPSKGKTNSRKTKSSCQSTRVQPLTCPEKVTSLHPNISTKVALPNVPPVLSTSKCTSLNYAVPSGKRPLRGEPEEGDACSGENSTSSCTAATVTQALVDERGRPGDMFSLNQMPQARILSDIVNDSSPYSNARSKSVLPYVAQTPPDGNEFPEENATSSGGHGNSTRASEGNGVPPETFATTSSSKATRSLNIFDGTNLPTQRSRITSPLKSSTLELPELVGVSVQVSSLACTKETLSFVSREPQAPSITNDSGKERYDGGRVDKISSIATMRSSNDSDEENVMVDSTTRHTSAKHAARKNNSPNHQCCKNDELAKTIKVQVKRVMSYSNPTETTNVSIGEDIKVSEESLPGKRTSKTSRPRTVQGTCFRVMTGRAHSQPLGEGCRRNDDTLQACNTTVPSAHSVESNMSSEGADCLEGSRHLPNEDIGMQSGSKEKGNSLCNREGQIIKSEDAKSKSSKFFSMHKDESRAHAGIGYRHEANERSRSSNSAHLVKNDNYRNRNGLSQKSKSSMVDGKSAGFPKEDDLFVNADNGMKQVERRSISEAKPRNLAKKIDYSRNHNEVHSCHRNEFMAVCKLSATNSYHDKHKSLGSRKDCLKNDSKMEASKKKVSEICERKSSRFN